MSGAGAFEASTPGRGADEAVPGLGDHERRAAAQDARRLAQDDLEPARVAVRARELARLLGRLDLVEAHDPALGLRDDLLRDADDVAVLELDAPGDHRGQVVALADLRQPLDGDGPGSFAHHAAARGLEDGLGEQARGRAGPSSASG